MNQLHKVLGFGLLTIFGMASIGVPQESTPVAINQPINDEGVDVQLRGPLHEAFAQPLDLNPEPGLVIPKKPPPPIPEEPPEVRPESASAEWIPGYWAWDSEREDFLWVSGVYRVPPQGRTFIPGYWETTSEGWRWISGFWSNDSQQEIAYTPQPPAPLDNGPSMPPPDDNSMYVPGNWIYRDSRFIWRPGYYAAIQDGRVWVPARYCWTPRGYAFVDSYWDAPFEDRGLIFAPVYFDQPYWGNPGWRYRPNFLLNLALFFDSAFWRHGGGHYYYGNYHDGRYARHGYRPWYDGAGRYDPTFAYHGWQNRRNQPNWASNQQQVYANRANGRAAAAPVTLAQQTAFVNAKKGSPVVTPVGQFKNDRVRLVTATPTQQKVQIANVQNAREIASNRQKLEAVVLNNKDRTTSANASTTVKRSNILGTNSKSVAPSVPVPSKSQSNDRLPKIVNSPPAAPKTAPATKSSPPPVTQQPSQQKAAPPQQKAAPPAQKAAPPPVQKAAPPQQKAAPPVQKATPLPAQKAAPPQQKAAPPVQKSSPPPVQKAAPPPVQKAAPPQQKAAPPVQKTAPPQQKAAPPAARKAAVNVTQPKVAPKAAAPQPRVQPAPRVQTPPRVSAPPPRSNPAPAKSSPAPRPAPTTKKR